MGEEVRGNLVGLWIILQLLLLLSMVSANLEAQILYTFRSSLQDPNNVLQSWNTTSGNPCPWYHVTCNGDNSVTRIDLGNSQLSGQLIPQLAQLQNLQYLELFANNLSGQIPSELGNLTNLVSLELFLNNFDGPIPGTLGKLQKLRFLRLNNNSLSGSIPMSLTTIATLQVLDLSNNDLSGPVPTNGSFSLFTAVSFENNLNLCGPVTGKTCPGSPSTSAPTSDAYSHGKCRKAGLFARGVVAIILLMLLPWQSCICNWRHFL